MFIFNPSLDVCGFQMSLMIHNKNPIHIMNEDRMWSLDPSQHHAHHPHTNTAECLKRNPRVWTGMLLLKVFLPLDKSEAHSVKESPAGWIFILTPFWRSSLLRSWTWHSKPLRTQNASPQTTLSILKYHYIWHIRLMLSIVLF